MERGGYIYILTNKNKTTLYAGVTSQLRARIVEHKTGKYPGSFSHRYNLHYVIYYEGFKSIDEAIGREKQIKKFTRKQKEELILQFNPEWKDLFDDLPE